MSEVANIKPGALVVAGKIISRIDELRQSKERELGERITWESVSEQTHLSYSTVLKWAKGQVNRYDDSTLAAFCEYFNCQPGDILVYEPA